MSAWGAFTISTQAMMAHSHAMGAISQNVSNVNTTGFKKVDGTFQTLLAESKATADFFSVHGNFRTLVEHNGPLQSTANWSDLAINGQGFFILNSRIDGSGETYFTRAGNFQQLAADIDADGKEETYLVDGNGYFLQGWPANEDGTIQTANDLGSLRPISYVRDRYEDGNPTTTVTLRGNVNANGSVEGVSVPVYDSGSNSQTLTLNFEKTDTAGTWTLNFAPVQGTSVTEPMTVVFDGDGRMSQPQGPITVEVTWDNGENSLLTLDLSDFDQFAGPTLIDNAEQDGRPPSFLDRARFSSNGVLNAHYGNGYTEALSQVAVADFVSVNNLEAVSGNLFRKTLAAGDMTVTTADKIGSAFLASTLEASNVDLADEFTRMITTQKAYSTAATAFRTADEMLQGASNLKR